MSWEQLTTEHVWRRGSAELWCIRRKLRATFQPRGLSSDVPWILCGLLTNLTNCHCRSFIWLACCGLATKSHRLASKFVAFCDMKMFNSPRPLPLVAINLYRHSFFNSFLFALHKSYNLCCSRGKCWCRSKLWGCFSPWLQTLGK